MSEKKRGFLGRLFGGKDSAGTAAEELKPETELLTGEEAATPAPEAEPEAAEDMATGSALPAEQPEPEATAATEPELVDELEDEPAEEAAPSAPVPVPAPVAMSEPQEKLSWFQRLRKGLARSSSALTEGISAIFTKRKLDAGMLEDLEDILLQADLGLETAGAITERLSEGRFDKEISPEEVRKILAEEVRKVLEPAARPLDLDRGHRPHVVLMVGVNGTGKTTTIGKLAHLFRSEGRSVLLCAADTFRAAAIEQLEIWAQRAGCEVIRQKQGADPSAVLFDAIQAARARSIDYLIADTAGRLHTKSNLMAELEKMRRTAARLVPGAPHETLLVMDATTGQNGIEQARRFTTTAAVTGIVLTKMDGTAKGGVVVPIARELGLPIRYLGVGEKLEDLVPFEAESFVASLLEA